mmetsp:Transcript_6790/g.12254  ORF Transcript_6790/g.12254 Transcript_6790/m.12254 type:complete len:734 (-) Transcript_6790:1146-3347(-)
MEGGIREVRQSAGKLRLASDRHRHASVSEDGTVVFEGSTVQLALEATISAIAVSQTSLYFGDESGKLWELNESGPEEIACFDSRVTYLSCGEGVLAVATGTSSVNIIKDKKTRALSCMHAGAVDTLDVSPDGKLVASLGLDGSLLIQDIYRDKLLRQCQVTSQIKSGLRGAWHPQNEYFALPGDVELRLISNKSWKLKNTQLALASMITIVAWSSDPDTLAVATQEGEVVIWSVSQELKIKEIPALSPPVDLAFTIDALYFSTENFKLFAFDIEVEPEEPAIEVQADPNKPQAAIDYSVDLPDCKCMFWSSLGQIYETTTSEATKYINIKFAESSFHSTIQFVNNGQYCIASMSVAGALFASKVSGEEEDVGGLRSQLLFKTFKYRAGLNEEWRHKLAWGETPETLAVGDDWCVVGMTDNLIRVFSIHGGVQLAVLSWPRPIVALSSYMSQLCVVYHEAAPFFGSQVMKLQILHMQGLSIRQRPEEFLKEEFSIAITPEETLDWVGYSDKGALFTHDSKGILRTLWRRCGTWVPVGNFPNTTVLGIVSDQLHCLQDMTPTLCPLSIPMAKSTTSPVEELAFMTQVLRDHAELFENTTMTCDQELLKAISEAFKANERIKVVSYAQLMRNPRYVQAVVSLCKQVLDIDDVSPLILSATHTELTLPKSIARPHKEQAEEMPKPTVQAVEKPAPKENVTPSNPFAQDSGKNSDFMSEVTLKRKGSSLEGDVKRRKV